MTGQEYEIQEYKMRSKEAGHEVLTDNTDRNSSQLASGRISLGITRNWDLGWSQDFARTQ